MERDNPVRICLFLFSLPLRKAIVSENLIDPQRGFLFHPKRLPYSSQKQLLILPKNARHSTLKIICYRPRNFLLQA